MDNGAPMTYRLPPLLALRAFEASARHLSFTKAGAELHLTQGAISRQIRLLENFLGLKLFNRLTRKIEMTESGREYFASIQNALSIISKATQHAVGDTRRVITLDVLPTLANQWLLPRLARFTEMHRDIEIRLVSSIDPADLHKEEGVVAIRVGRLPGSRYDRNAPRIDLEMTDNWKDLYIEPLFPDILVPVVSAQLVNEVGDISVPADLLQYRLINTASRRHAWDDWLALYGLERPVDKNALDFGHFFMALQAAKDGKGVAIVPKVIFQNYLDRGDLLVPLTDEVESAGGYYLLTRNSGRTEPAIRLVCDWLEKEAATYSSLPAPASTLVSEAVPA